MDIRSGFKLDHPEVERAMRFARIVGFGSWTFGLLIFGVACLSREPWLFIGFGGWYLALALIISVVAAVPRKRQAALDQEWGSRFRELAIRDDLTGLHNRRYFNSELEAQFAACRSGARPLAIALIDLNDFKTINDTFGHAAGDMALRIAGQAILDASPPNATVARTGGDEFAVIMPGKSRGDAEAVAHKIRFALEETNFVTDTGRGGRGHIQATVGVAALGEGHDPRALLQEADASLYHRKRTQRAA